MEVLDQLAWALGLSTLAGLNLYLTTFVTGLAIRFNWLSLAERYGDLEILAHPAILTVAGVLFLLEFFADKIPWIDSAWDVLHTIIRPIGGICLALAALGELDPAFSVVAALLAGGSTLTTHLAKAGGRFFVNLSPEPVSNILVSSAEDGFVLASLGTLAFAPIPALIFFVLFLGFAAWLLFRTQRFFRSGLRKIFRRKAKPSLTHEQ